MSIHLTDEQCRVVEHSGSPLRVIAGPGTGKTSCLAARIRKLILKDRVPPNRILAVTLTRAAAGEMRQKLEKQGVAPDRIPDVRTLHSKAVALLRRHSALLNLNVNVRPLGSTEVNLVLKDIAADLASAGFRLPFRGPRNIQKYLKGYQSEQSGAGIPNWISSNREYLKTYHEFSRAYEGLQGFYNGIDWFRVVNLALQLLSSQADVLEKERAAVDHILVDEYQDLNWKDQEFTRILTGDASGLCVVGDEDQSIYESQRFASPAGLIEFDRYVHGTTTLALTYCHRCPKQVLDEANALIRNNKIRMCGKPPLRAIDPTRTGIVATVSHRSKKAEIEWLVKKVSQLHGKRFEYRDILILFAEGQIGQDYISALEEAHVPLTVQLKVAGPFDSVCFVRVLATLRFLSDRSDNLAVRQCLDYWPNIGATTIRELRRLATNSARTLLEAVSAVASDPNAHRMIARRKAVRDFYNAMTKLQGVKGFGRLLPAILKYLPDCATDPGVAVLSQFFDKQKGKEAALSISEILQNFEQEREAGKFETTEELPDRVRIMTMHSAKGLEAKEVMIPAMEDDLMPGQLGNIEERRRLFYVSVTRAKEILYLSWASQRVGQEIHRKGGRMLGKQRSRFLTEMGE